jgi:cell division protein FtsB
MTRASPADYTDDELVVRAAVRRERRTRMKVGEKAILGAVATVLREERAARDQAVDELRATIAALQARIETLEREPARRLRAVGE